MKSLKKLVAVGAVVTLAGAGMFTMANPDAVFAGKAEDAEKQAIEASGLSIDDILDIHTSTDHEKGVKTYEIEIKTQDKEYEYEIDAETGEIISVEIEDEDFDDDEDDIEDEDDDYEEDDD